MENTCLENLLKREDIGASIGLSSYDNGTLSFDKACFDINFVCKLISTHEQFKKYLNIHI
jgi:hypothetical protein